MKRTTTAMMMLAACGAAKAQTINIPPESLPSEAYFASNPGVTVNVCCTESIFPDGDGGTFDFNGAMVNINAGGGSGFFTVDHFVENVTYTLDGGDLVRAKFVGSIGTTELFVNSGNVERGLWLQGDTACTIAGGSIGSVTGGQAAMIVEDSASCAMSAGDIDTFIVIGDSATFEQSGGTIAGGIQMNDDAEVTISGGSSGDDGFMRDIGCVLNLAGGTVGDAFVVEKGVVNISAGGMGTNSAILNTLGVDPVINMTSGAIGSDFRAYDGTMNVSGGLIGDGFRLGRPTGDGSGVTLNLVVKSATLEGTPLSLSTTPTEITARAGEFLSCVMLDDSVIGLDLNETFVSGEDRVRVGAVLTIATVCPADTNGDGLLSPADFSAWIAAFNAMTAACDQNGDGSCTPADFTAWIANYNAGC